MHDTNILKSISLEEAMQLQFNLVDKTTLFFNGRDILTLGDLGVEKTHNKPLTTYKVEQVIAAFFNVEMALLVRGAGTGALKEGISSIVKPGGTILVHDAPIYETTKYTFEYLNLKIVRCDFNNLDDIKRTIQTTEIDAALIQHTRQTSTDAYNLETVIQTIKQLKDIPIVTDDNYAVMKSPKIGAQLGAELSTFSVFKLLGPEGIGCVLGKKQYVDQIKKTMYSGGSQIQGYEALETLRGLVYAPVSLAIQSTIVDEIVSKINTAVIKGIKQAFVANAQSKVIIVEFDSPIAPLVLEEAIKLGAASHPIGAESKYEFVPMFYRVSKTFLDSYKGNSNTLIRINPMRSGSDTVIRILKEAVRKVDSCI